MGYSSIGVAIIARNVEATVRNCIQSFADEVDQIVVVLAGESNDNTRKEVELSSPKVEIYEFSWCDDFAAARNFSFSKLHCDFILWCDADDVIIHPENFRKIVDNASPEIGAVWFPYHYAVDEFGNISTLYERERLLRASYGWVWKGRLHETVSPLRQCQFVRSDEVIFRHNHLAGQPRNERNFRILNKMLEEDPNDKRIWLYLGHQNFAGQNWMEAAQWYLKFGSDPQAISVERYQALCYCSKAMREMQDRQAIDVALMAMELSPNYRDAYLEMAHAYLTFGDIDKAIHYAKLSDVKDLITEPPHIIFINPLEYTFNKYALLAECYMKRGEFEEALRYLQQAIHIRPTSEVKANAEFIQGLNTRKQVADSIKTLAIHLLNSKELVKLAPLLNSTPYWFRDLPDYQELKAGVEHYTKGIEDKPEIAEGENNSVLVNVGNAINLNKLLDELDKKYDKVTVVCPIPAPQSQQINALSQNDMENLIIANEGRHIINLQREQSRIICEYDKNVPKELAVRFYLGQGLEYWSPKTINETGCGGSETAVAWTARELVKKGCQPIIYAMDTQVWDGVIYRHHSNYRPNNISSHLFVSSRVPDVFNADIPANQKWLWFHDVHCGDRFTPEIADRIDAIIALSHWHVGNLKRAYPFLKDAEIIDMDKNFVSYDDECDTPKFYENDKCFRLPKIAVIGNGIDTDRFKELTEERLPHRFIWCSSPDRGLEQVLEMWPLIKKALPDAELKIFYGWEYFNSSLFIPQQRELKEKIRKLIRQDGIEWCGRVGQQQIAKELMRSSLMLYPPHPFRETYGIAFLEAQAAGVICVYRQNGALGETISNRGIPLKMDATPQDIVDKITTTLDNKDCGIIRNRAREYALARDWSIQADKFLELYKQLEKRR